MNTVVSRLLDVDREARDLLAEAHAYQDQMRENIEREKEKLLAIYTEKSQNHLGELEAEQAAECREYLADIEQRTVERLAALQQQYDQNHQSWEDRLFRRCVGGEEA